MASRKVKWKKARPRKPLKKSQRELRIEKAIIEWEGISEGLSIQEKFRLAKEIRGSGILPVGIRARLSVPTNDMWQKLTKKITLVIIAREGANRSDRVLIPIRFPFNFRSCLKDFPTSSKMVDADMLSVTMLYNATKVLDWLYDRGYSRYSSRQLRKHIGVFNKWLSEWENEFNILNQYGVDSDIVAEYANVIDSFEKGEDDV